jgi:hypothetical protein
MALKARTVGHLVEFRLTNGRAHAFDPENIVECGTPRGQPDVTILRTRGDDWAHYVALPYDETIAVIGAALASRGVLYPNS